MKEEKEKMKKKITLEKKTTYIYSELRYRLKICKETLDPLYSIEDDRKSHITLVSALIQLPQVKGISLNF